MPRADWRGAVHPRMRRCVAIVAGTYQPALEVEVRDAAVEAVAFRAEDIRLIELHVVEVDLAAAIHAKTELVQRAQFDARLAHVHHELGEDAGIIGVLRHDDEPLHALGGGDEGLGAVQVDVTVATLVVGGESGDIGACAWFGASGVPDLLAGADMP